MDIWTLEIWKKHYNLDDPNHRKGLYTRFEKGVDPEVKRACSAFCKWLRAEYFFPIRVVIYFKKSEFIKAKEGDLVVGTIFVPYDYQEEPYIRAATGDYESMLKKDGKFNSLASILRTVAHELTHYFQWINDIELTPIGKERQATMYSGYVIYEYPDTVDEP